MVPTIYRINTSVSVVPFARSLLTILPMPGPAVHYPGVVGPSSAHYGTHFAAIVAKGLVSFLLVVRNMFKMLTGNPAADCLWKGLFIEPEKFPPGTLNTVISIFIYNH